MACTDSRRTSRSLAWSRAIILLLLVLICAVAYWMRFAATKADANAGLSVPEDALDFGEVWEDERFQWTLPIKNPTQREVEIVSFQSTPLCTSIEPASLVIPAGDTAEVKLTLDLSRFCTFQEGQRVREFVARVAPVIKYDVPGQRGWEIRGRVRASLLVDPIFIDFGDNVVHGQPAVSRVVKIGAPAPLAKIVPRFDSARVSATLNMLDTGCSYQLEVTPNPSLSQGEFEADIFFEMVTVRGEILPRKRLPIKGVVKDDIQAFPSTILLGAVREGDSVHEMVTLHSASQSPVHVKAVSTSSEATVVAVDGDTSPQCKQYKVTQLIVGRDSHAGEIIFQLQDAAGQGRKIVVPIIYFGVPR